MMREPGTILTLVSIFIGCIEQRKSLEAYWNIYGGKTDYSTIASTTVKILIQRMEHHRA